MKIQLVEAQKAVKIIILGRFSSHVWLPDTPKSWNLFKCARKEFWRLINNSIWWSFAFAATTRRFNLKQYQNGKTCSNMLTSEIFPKFSLKPITKSVMSWKASSTTQVEPRNQLISSHLGRCQAPRNLDHPKLSQKGNATNLGILWRPKLSQIHTCTIHRWSICLEVSHWLSPRMRMNRLFCSFRLRHGTRVFAFRWQKMNHSKTN